MRLLDLFCGAGGAAMGYHRAGFEVIGVDKEPQPNYPFTFYQGDALEADLHIAFVKPDAIHASPPCQFASAGGNIWHTRLGPASERHPNLIPPTREMLVTSGLPYVIENVERAREWLRNPHLICGLALGLGVKRHRLFETTFPLLVPECPPGHPGDWISVFGNGALSRTPKGGQARINGKHNGKGANDGRVHISHERASAAMGIDWMNRDELSESIPPAMTELIGHQLALHLRGLRLERAGQRRDERDRQRLLERAAAESARTRTSGAHGAVPANEQGRPKCQPHS